MPTFSKSRFLTIILSIIGVTILRSQSIPIEIFKRDLQQEVQWNTLRSNQKIRVIQYDRLLYTKLKATQDERVSMMIPTPDGDIVLNLEKNNFLAAGFNIKNDRKETVSYEPGLFYQGEIDGQPGSFAAISFFDDEVVAVINTIGNKKYVVGQSNALRRESYVVYDAAQATAPSIDCMSESLPGYIEKSSHISLPKLEQRVADGCINVYFELGNSVYNNKGGIIGAVNYITGIFNVVSGLYAKDGINVKISEIFVWTNAEPYNASASTALTDFGRAKQLNFNGNIAQLVRLKSAGSLSGIAWLSTLCSPYIASVAAGPYSYAEVLPSYSNLPAYSWTSEVITHEIGHNLGSPHTHSCNWPGGPIDNCHAPEGTCSAGPTPINGGTIMSYCHLTSIGINFNNGFGPQPKALILNAINNGSCVIACNTVAPPAPICTPPIGLGATNITASGSSLNWSAVSGASSYSINYKIATNTSWTILTSSTTALTVNLTGLIPGTTYQWQVKANCGSTNSAYSESQFTTALATPNCTSTPPTGLTVTNVTTSSATANWTAVPGADSYSMQYKVLGTTAWITASTNVTTLSFNMVSLSQNTTYQWQIAANCTGGNSEYTSGQFTTLTAINCASIPPTGLSVTNINTSGASLSWISNTYATSYSVDYKLASATNWTNHLNNTTGTTAVLSGLQASTAYHWRVKSNCSVGTSGYATSDFVTSSPSTCIAPTNLSTTNISQTSAHLSWTAVASAFNYTIEFKKATSASWLVLTNTSATTINMSGLVAGTVYDWRIRTNCASGVSGYTQSQFKASGSTAPPTPTVCNVPANLTSTNMNATTTTLSWSGNAEAVSYQLEYKLATAAIWTTITVSNNMYQLDKLSTSSIYDWRVKSNCSGNSSSSFANAQFNTLAAADTCPGSMDLKENESFTTAQPISMNEEIMGKISPAADNDFYKFMVTVGGNLTIDLTNLPADYDLRVYSGSGASMGISQNSDLKPEQVNLYLSPGAYYARVYGWNNSHHDDRCYSLRIQTNTAKIEFNAILSEKTDWTVKLSPNPTRQQLTIDLVGLTTNASISVFDLQGKLHKKTSISAGSGFMNVADLPAGFYILKAEAANQSYKAVKFLKIS
ncbi:MAG: fibronectin type III domain-containing protein [Saprospiraceae bacterium]|nr:fibronectin type III domain-containing protein [Saprospiraceae bacterium]